MALGEFPGASEYIMNDPHIRDLHRNFLDRELRTAKVLKGNSPGENPSYPQDEGSDDLDKFQRKIQARLYQRKVTMDDVVGLEDAKRVLIANLSLARAKKHQGINFTPQKTTMLFGPEGTGKSLLLAATAFSLHVPLYPLTIAEIFNSKVGDSPKMIQAAFAVARRNAPAMLAIEELNGINLDKDTSGVANEVIQTLKSETDGLSSKGNEKTPAVFVVTSTNEPTEIPPTLLSRMTNRIYCRLPRTSARSLILEKGIESTGLPHSIDLFHLGDESEGLSGRQLIEQVLVPGIITMYRDANPQKWDAMLSGKMNWEETWDHRPLRLSDFSKPLALCEPLTPFDKLAEYEEWDRAFGTHIDW